MEITSVKLYEIYNLIKKYEKAYEEYYEVFGKDTLQYSGVNKMFEYLPSDLKFDVEKGFISKDMSKEYLDALAEMQDNIREPYAAGKARFYKLLEINKKQTEDCEKADKKLKEAFQVKWENEDKDTKEESKDIKDSKKELEHINDLMRFYETSYTNSDALESVDGLAELVNGIKEAAENKFISESTAKTLIKPLQEIKDNIFNDEIHKQKMEEFSDVLQQKISNGEEEKGVFRSIVDGIDSLNIGKEETQHTMNATDTVKTQDEADKVLETQRQATKENQSRNNEAQEKALREQVSKNEEQKQGEKSEKNHALDPLKKAIDDYRFLLANGFSVYPAWVDLRKEIKASVNEGVITQQKAEELNDVLLNYDKASRLEALNEILNNDDYFTDKQYVIKAEKTKDNTDKKQEVKSAEEQLPQSKALDPRTVAQDQARLNEQISQLKPQEQVNIPAQDEVFDIKDNSNEAGRKRIQAMKEKHGIKFRDGHEAGVLIPKNIAEIMRSELGNSDIEKKYYEDIRKFVYDYTGIFNNGKGQDIGDFREKTSTVSENKHNAISEDQKQEAIEKIRNFIMTYDNLSSYDQGEANYELDKFSRYISSAAKEGLISGYEAAQYKDIIDNTYQKNDKRVSSEAVTKLWKLYKNQQSILSNSSQEQQPQSKALDPRTASQDQARVDDAFKPQEQNGQQDRKFGDRIRREDVPSFREGVKSITDKYKDQEQKKINREESQHTMTVADAAKTQDEADKVLETQRQVSKENSGKGNEEQEKTIREQVSKNEKQEKALDPRTASQDQARVDDAFKPQEEQKSQDKFSAFRAQLERKVPLEKDENTDNKKIDKPAAFKAGIENTKKLAENRQKAMMNYYMKKRKMEWDDH